MDALRKAVDWLANRRGLWVFTFLVVGLPALLSAAVLPFNAPLAFPWFVLTWTVEAVAGYRIWRIDHPHRSARRQLARGGYALLTWTAAFIALLVIRAEPIVLVAIFVAWLLLMALLGLGLWLAGRGTNEDRGESFERIAPSMSNERLGGTSIERSPVSSESTVSDPSRDPILSWSPSGPVPDLGPPKRRLRWSVLLVALGLGLVGWVSVGALILLALLAVLGLESGNHPEHAAEFTRLAAIWLVGTIVGIVAIAVTRRRTAARAA
jgi:hypothetical protein